MDPIPLHLTFPAGGDTADDPNDQQARQHSPKTDQPDTPIDVWRAALRLIPEHTPVTSRTDTRRPPLA